MSLLADIPTIDSEAAFLAATRRIVPKLLSLSAPRSLVELRLADADFHWLQIWARSLSSSWLRSNLAGFGRHAPVDTGLRLRRVEALGCMLLLVAAESARRDAREGAVWPTVQECFAPTISRVLFAGGQPTTDFKDALEAAARRLGLRHVFGIEGTQSYYVTVFLQFGLTRRGLGKLAHWLCGAHCPEAVQHLLGDRLASASFAHLWRAMRDLRRRNVSEQQFRSLAATSPWVLPDWIDDLVREVRARPELGSSPHASGDGDDHSFDVGFLDVPTLRWIPPARPTFTARLANLAYFDLAASRYDVCGGDGVLATLLRQEDGSYLHEEEIDLPSDRPFVAVSLKGDDGSVAAIQEVRLWDPSNEVQVFDISGAALDAWQRTMDPSRAYLLLTEPDLSFEPPLATWHVVGNGARRLSQLPAGWSSDLRITLDGHELWTPLLRDSSMARPSSPTWLRMPMLLPPLSARPSGNLEIKVLDVPDDVDVAYVRLAGEPWEFERQGNRVILAPIPYTVERALHGIPVRVGLTRGREFARLQHVIPLAPRSGAARAVAGGWEWVDPSASLTVEEARESIYRPFLDPRSGASAALIEGHTYSRRVDTRPRPLGSLGGFGAPLRLYAGPYNVDRPVATLAADVTDPGVLRHVERVNSTTWRVQLHRPLSPDSSLRVLLWPSMRKPGVLPASALAAVEPALWELSGVPLNPQSALMSIDYRGERLGAWWPRERFAWEPPPPDVVPPASVAAILRWMRAPLLEAATRRIIEPFAHAHPGACLAAWVRGQHQPGGFVSAPSSEEWFAAVREIFRSWEPKVVDLEDVVATFLDDPVEPLLIALVAGLQRDPLLLDRLLQVWPLADPKWRLDLETDVRQARCVAAGLPQDASSSELAEAERVTLQQAAEVMGVDPAFLENGIIRRAFDGKLALTDGFNLRVALGVAPFRALYACHALTAFQRRAGKMPKSRRR